MYKPIYTVSRAIFIANNVPMEHKQDIQMLATLLEQSPYHFTVTRLFDELATQRNIRDVFQSLADEDIDGRVFIFLAGQSKLDADTNTQYYMCADSNGHLESSAMSYVEIGQLCSICSAKHVGLILDTPIDLLGYFMNNFLEFGRILASNPKERKSHQFMMRDSQLEYSLARAFHEYLTTPQSESISMFYMLYRRVHMRESYPNGLHLSFKNDGYGDFLFDENSFDAWIERIAEERKKRHEE